jgi:hypothetical protein
MSDEAKNEEPAHPETERAEGAAYLATERAASEAGRAAALALVGGRDPERTLEDIRRRHEQRSTRVPDPLATYDTLGRKQFTRSSIWSFLRWIPGLAGRLAVVPPSAIPEQGADENGIYSFIECPCGAQPVARAAIEKCVGCERYYVISPDGGRVVVLYGDMPIPGATASK